MTMMRSLIVASCLLLAAAALAPAGAVHASPPEPGNYYLALGDSLGIGFEATGIPVDPTCQSPTAPGYVCAFYRYLMQINPQIQLDNLSIPGADSCVLVHGFGTGSPCTNRPTLGPVPSPLTAAVQFIKAHSGEVSPITIDIGGDDLLPLLPEGVKDPLGTAARLPAVFKSYQANLDQALSTLRGAAANAEIIIATQYNPIGGIASPPLPAGLPEIGKNAINAMNAIMKQEAQKYNLVVADVAAAFDANPGGAALLTFVPVSLAGGNPADINIHPKPEGYALYAQTVIKASGYLAPLKVQAHLAKKRVGRGKSQKVTGTTAAGAVVSIKIWLPHKSARTLKTSAGSDGTFSRSFKVGKARGKGAVQVCAADVTGQSRCTSKMTYTIR